MASSLRSARAGTASPPKRTGPLASHVLDELADLIDDGEGVQVALALRLAPGEQAVAAEHDAVAAGILADGAGASSWPSSKPGRCQGSQTSEWSNSRLNSSIFVFAVGRGGQRDAPVGMQMVDVREGKKAVQRRVDGGGDRVVAEGAERVHRHHVVFVVDALVDCARAPAASPGRAWRSRCA